MSKSRSVVDGEQHEPNPMRLALARKRRGLTQTAFAEKIGVIRRSVVAYEAGETTPSFETLETISKTLGFPEEFFYGDDLDEPSLDSGSFRSMSKMTAAQRDMALSQAALGIHFAKWLENRFELPKSDLPDLSREPDPEAAAESLRRAWGLGALSIRNMIHLVEAKGGPRFFARFGRERGGRFFNVERGSTFHFLEYSQVSRTRSLRCRS